MHDQSTETPLVPCPDTFGSFYRDCEAEEVIDYSGFRFAKPGKKKREPVKTLRDGRQKLNTKTAAGKREYKARLVKAWTEQKGRCYLCGKPIALEEATPEHVNPKGHGGGSHDDRQSNIKAACWPCNRSKGSKRLPSVEIAYLPRSEWPKSVLDIFEKWNGKNVRDK